MVGFIALAGVSVMSGVVMTTRLLETDPELPVARRVQEAAESAFRPTMSTALVAALGFIPMAIATSAGAEVQRPLATVVIGGLIIGVLVSVLAMPAMLLIVGRRFSLPVVDRAHPHPEQDVPHGAGHEPVSESHPAPAE
jgi:cobalt-zinc-cadmium resistance protein CzcA